MQFLLYNALTCLKLPRYLDFVILPNQFQEISYKPSGLLGGRPIRNDSALYLFRFVGV